MAMSSTISQLLEEMENWDKDKRFMAASDLMQEITMSNQALDLHLQKRVCQAFLKQLEDQSIDVQGNAVKCLAKIVCKFQDQQVGEVVGKLSQLVLDGKPEVRDIYSTCLKGLLAELPSSCSQHAIQNVLPKMLHGVTSNPSPEVKEECTDVLHDVLKRFGDNRVMQWSDQENMANSLLNLLKPKQYKTSLRKKVIACIGALSTVLGDRQLDGLMRTLLADVRSATSKVEKQKYIQCISTVSRNVGFRIGSHLRDIGPLFLQIVRQSTENSDADMDNRNETSEHEVVENCLNAFESFVLRCSKEIATLLEELCELMLTLISYDPNFYDSGDGDGEAMDLDFEELDDDNLQDSEDDDDSWKVRRAALKVLAAMVQGTPDRLDMVYKKFAQPLINRFSEREENVRLDVFSTFGEMAKAAVIKSQASSVTGTVEEHGTLGVLEIPRTPPPKERPSAECLVAVLPSCITALNKQFRSKSIKTRQGALVLVSTLAECLPRHIEPMLPQLKDELVKCMNESNSTLRLEALTCLRYLAENHANVGVYQQLAPAFCPLLLQAMHDTYYKSIAQSLRVCGAYVYTLRPSVDQTSPACREMLPVFGILLGKLVATDIDQEVKESALECLGNLIACTGDLPEFQESVQACLPPFVERFRNEVTRSTAIRALKAVSVSKVQVQALQSALPALGSQLSSYLSQNRRAFRQQCLDALVHLEKKYGSKIPVDTHLQILNDITPFITDTDLYITDLCVQVADQVLESAPQTAPTVAERTVPAVLNVCHSPLLQGGALDSILNFLSRIAKHRQHFPFEQLCAQLSNTSVVATATNQAQRQIVGNLAKGLASIICASPADAQANAVKRLLASVQQRPATTSPEAVCQCELSLLALGETGKYVDLSKYQVSGVLLQQFECQQDEIRLAAALALGYATVGAMANMLKFVIDQVQASKGQKIQYMLLTSLREVIASTGGKNGRSISDHLKPHVPRVMPILAQYADSAEESVRNVVSESLGHLIAVDQDVLLRSLTPMLSSRDSWRIRATTVSAIGFAAKGKCPPAMLAPLKEPMLNCLGDEEMQVRKAALQSVNVICLSATCSELLRPHVDLILQRLREDSKPRPELVREVDLGPFKHKVDDGLPLRKYAYTVCTSLLAAYPEQVVSPQIIDLVLQGLADDDDVQVLSCQILQDLCSCNFALFRITGRIGDLVEPFDRCITRNSKNIQAKKQVGKSTDMLRLYARTLRMLAPIAEAEQHKTFMDFMARILKDQAFQAIYEPMNTTESL